MSAFAACTQCRYYPSDLWAVRQRCSRLIRTGAGEEVVGQLVWRGGGGGFKYYQTACQEFLAAFWEMSSYILCAWWKKRRTAYLSLAEVVKVFLPDKICYFFHSSLVFSVIRLSLDLTACSAFLVCLFVSGLVLWPIHPSQRCYPFASQGLFDSFSVGPVKMSLLFLSSLRPRLNLRSLQALFVQGCVLLLFCVGPCL